MADIEFTQQLFLGASIIEFSTGIGWNDQSSEFRVVVVEDDSTANGRTADEFLPAANLGTNYIGLPYKFQYEEWTFIGLMQSWTESNSVDGKPTYQITLVDPREVLSGAQVICGSYTGTTLGVPNLLNPFGYFENIIGFGSAGLNEGGMPWNNIFAGIILLQFGANPSFGGPLSFMGHSYLIDFTEVPTVPTHYRINQTNIGLLDIVAQIMEDAGSDYFVELIETNSNNVWIIKFRSVSRTNIPPLGQIRDFIESAVDITNSNNIGEELRNENTTGFLVGGQQNILFQQAQDPILLPEPHEDNIILPYFGLDKNGSAIIGHGTGTGYEFQIDSRHIRLYGGIPLGNEYTVDVGEMAAALAGQPSWETYISFIRPTRANALGAVSQTGGIQTIIDYLKKQKLLPKDLVNTRAQRGLTGLKRTEDIELNKNIVYEFVRNYANEFYGKKFMVRIPFINCRIVPDTLQLETSVVVTEGGFVEESASPLGLDPLSVNFFRIEDGRVGSFVRYDTLTRFDLRKMQASSFIIDGSQDALFVKCNAESIVFRNRPNCEDPRVVISLDTSIELKGGGFGFGGPLISSFIKSINASSVGGITNVQKSKIIALFKEPGSDNLFLGENNEFITPDYAALPLESKIATYGPWISIGSPGKINFEQDTDLAPWNYGTFESLNLAGNARVAKATFMQVGELGDITVAGVPIIQLGDALQLGGPNITGIDVTIGRGNQGVTTTYRMRTYTPKISRFNKQNADRFRRLGKTGAQYRRGLRTLTKLNRKLSKLSKEQSAGFFDATSDIKRGGNQPGMLVGYHLPSVSDLNDDNNTKILDRFEIVTAGVHEGTLNLGSTDGNIFRGTKHSLGYEGLYLPVSIDSTEAITGPDFSLYNKQRVTSGGSGIGASTYAPYMMGHSIEVVNRDNAKDISIFKDRDGALRRFPSVGEQYHTFAYRGPIMLTSWGYDIDGKPVPGTDDTFNENFLSEPNTWPLGPIDFRWDADREVWTMPAASGGGVSSSSLAVCSFTQRNMGDCAPGCDPWKSYEVSIIRPAESAAETIAFNPLCKTFEEGQIGILFPDISGWAILSVETSPHVFAVCVDCSGSEITICDEFVNIEGLPQRIPQGSFPGNVHCPGEDYTDTCLIEVCTFGA